MAAIAFTREDLALRTQPTLGSPQHSPLHRPQPHPHEKPTSGLGLSPSHQARSTVPLDTARSSQGASCQPPHCPEPRREEPTAARLTLGMVRVLEHCRVLLKGGKTRVGEGALASASVLRVLTWTEQGASYAGGRAAWSPAGLAHPSSCGAVAAGQSSAPACCLGCGGAATGPGPGQWIGLPGMTAGGGGLPEASEAFLESGPGMRVWCGCQVRSQPSPLSCGQQSRQGGETQLGPTWKGEDRRKAGSQRCQEDSTCEDRRQGGRQGCQEDGEASRDAGRTRRRGALRTCRVTGGRPPSRDRGPAEDSGSFSGPVPRCPPGLDGHSAEAECSQSWGLNGAMALPGAGCISGTGVFLKTVAFSDIGLFSESLALSGTSLFPETALSSSTEIFWDTEHLLGLGVSGSRLASGSSVFPAAVSF